MVEKERDGGEANTMSGPWQEGGGGAGLGETAVGERKEREGDNEDEQKQKDEEGEEEEWSEIRLAIEELSPMIERGGGKLVSSPPTLPFLGLSHLLLQVLDKIGPTMAVLRLDVQRNIERLQELYMLDPSKYSTLADIVEEEVKEGTARKVDSCARAILWLTRSVEFTIALLQRLEQDSEQQSLAQLVEAAYKVTLKPWHGWISSAAYKIATKLIPERKIFVSLLVGKGQDCNVLKDDIQKLVQLLQPFLDDIHATMAKFRLDRLNST